MLCDTGKNSHRYENLQPHAVLDRTTFSLQFLQNTGIKRILAASNWYPEKRTIIPVKHNTHVTAIQISPILYELH